MSLEVDTGVDKTILSAYFPPLYSCAGHESAVLVYDDCVLLQQGNLSACVALAELFNSRFSLLKARLKLPLCATG